MRLLDLPPEMLAMLWPAQRRSHGRESCKALRRCLEPGSKNCTKELCWVFLNVPRFVSSAHLEERLVFLVGLCRRVKVSMGVSGRDHTDGDLKSLTLSRKAFWNLLGQGMIMKLLSMLPRLCACDPGAMRAWVRDFCRLTKEGCADLERRFLGAVRQG